MCQQLGIFVTTLSWSVMAKMATILKNGHFGHYQPAQCSDEYGQPMTDYESIGKMEISSENGFEKNAMSKK